LPWQGCARQCSGAGRACRVRVEGNQWRCCEPLLLRAPSAYGLAVVAGSVKFHGLAGRRVACCRNGRLRGTAARKCQSSENVSTGIDPERLRQVYAVYPRPSGGAFILDAIVDHAARSDAAAPPYSMAAELLRQRRAEAAP
jgi:hypothetical protein